MPYFKACMHMQPHLSNRIHKVFFKVRINCRPRANKARSTAWAWQAALKHAAWPVMASRTARSELQSFSTFQAARNRT